MGSFGRSTESDYIARLQKRIGELEGELRLRDSAAEERTLTLIRQVMENAPVGFSFLDTEFRYLVVNQKLADMNDLPISSHIGHRVDEIVGQVARQLRPSFDRVLATGNPFKLEFSTETGGTTRHWLRSMYPVRHADGTLLGVASVAVEITEHKRALEEALLNQQRLELAQAAAGIGSWEWDLRTNEVHCSPEYSSLYGLPCGIDLNYEEWQDRLHPDDRQWVIDDFNRVLAGSDGYVWEFRTVWPDGSVHWILSKGRLHRDAEGTPRRVFGVNMDITERKQAEQAIRQSEQRFRSMADAAAVMICAAGPDGQAEFFNKGWLHFTGRTKEQELGAGWLQGVHPEDRARAMAEIGSSFDSRLYCQTEYRLRRADGEYRWILCHGAPRYQPDGEFTGYVASAIDITTLKLSQEAELVRQKMASVGVVAAGVAHDLNNLLASVVAESELLNLELPPASPARNGIGRVNLLAGRAVEIAQEFLVYAGTETSAFETLDLAKLVREMTELLTISVSKLAGLRIVPQPKMPTIWGNASQLRQVVVNLVTNASEAMGTRNGTITLTVGLAQVTPQTSAEYEPHLAEGDYVRLEVSDNGCGMTDETRTRIFDPFFTTKAKGRGLGLSVVQGIVRTHRGGVRVTSRPGGGTRFEVLLPRMGAPTVESGNIA